MLIFCYLLVPMVLAATCELNPNIYAAKIKSGVLKSISVIGEPLDALDLSSLGIRFIDINVFANLTHVKSINLANNSISVVPRATFMYLQELENLSLADNAISSFQYRTFSELSNLKFLNISNNPLEELTRYGLRKSTNIAARFTRDFLQLHIVLFVDDDDVLVIDVPKCYLSDGPVWYSGEIACIHDEILEKVKPDTITSELHCRPVSCLHALPWHTLNLENLEISKFAVGWYSLNKNVEIINLKNNNIIDITTNLLNGLPAHIKTIDLSNNKIVHLKKGIIINKDMKLLNLSNNFISEIADGALEETKLISVDLSKNRLNNTRFVKTLPPTLASLTLSDNCINELVPDTFSRFHELDTIDFAGNNIAVITKESLRGFNSAKKLIFARNNIEKIEIGAFRTFATLWNLDLSNNKLSTLDKGVFDGLYGLTHLDLSYNGIKEITLDSFYGLLGAGEPSSKLFDDREN